MSFAMNFRTLIAISLLVSTMISCEQKEEEEKPGTTGDGVSTTDGHMTTHGTLNIEAVGGKTPTHVYASSPDTPNQAIGEVGADGTFNVEVEQGPPFTLAIIDTSQTGSEMVVAVFNSSELDSISATEQGTKLNLGNITMASGLTSTGYAKFQTSETYESLLSQMGLDAEVAGLISEKDDVLGRYSSPDIDGNGTPDVSENVRFYMSYTYRFATHIDGSSVDGDAIKNKYLPNKVAFPYQWASIEFSHPDDYFTTAPTEYVFTFDEEIEARDTYVEGTFPAGTAISTKPYGTFGANGFLGVKIPPEGTYKIEAGGKTFTFNNVVRSDFTGGKGFLMPFVKMNVSSANLLTGFDFVWKKLQSDNTWTEATQLEMETLVKSGGFGISFAIGTTGAFYVNSIEGLSGSIVLSEITSPGSRPSLSTSGITTEQALATDYDDLKSGGVVVSHKDKMGIIFSQPYKVYN